MIYWKNKGRYQIEYDKLSKKLVPGTGSASTPHGELLLAVGRVYYDWYNNGGCNLNLSRFQYHLQTIKQWASQINNYLNVDKTFKGADCVIEPLLTWADDDTLAWNDADEDGDQDLSPKVVPDGWEVQLELLVDGVICLVRDIDAEQGQLRIVEEIRKAKELLESDVHQQPGTKDRVEALQWVLGEVETCTAHVETKTAKRKKVYGGTFDGTWYLIVAAESKAAALRALNIAGARLSMYAFNQGHSVTSNATDRMVALGKPGVVFRARDTGHSRSVDSYEVWK